MGDRWGSPGIPFLFDMRWPTDVDLLDRHPGTGKSTVALGLQAKGWKVLEVNDLAKRHGCSAARTRHGTATTWTWTSCRRPWRRSGSTMVS